MCLFQLRLSQGKCPVVGFFKESPHCLPQWLYPFAFPLDSLFSTLSPAFIFVDFFIMAILTGVKWTVSWFCGLMGSSGWFFYSTWCQLGHWAEMVQVPSTTFSLWLIWAFSARQLNFERVNPKTIEEKLQLLLKAQAQSLVYHLHCPLVHKTNYTPAQIQGQGQWTLPFKGHEHIGRLGWTYTHFGCSVAKSRQTFGDPMNCSRPGSSVLHYLLQLAHIHVPPVSDAV